MGAVRKRLDTVLVERGPVRVAQQGGRGGRGGRRAGRRGPRAGGKAGHGGRSGGRPRGPRAGALRLARRAEAGARAGRARRSRWRAGGASTRVRPPAGSPIACSSAARRTSSPSTSPTESSHWSLRKDSRVTVLERMQRRGRSMPRTSLPPGSDRRRPVVHRPREGAAGARRRRRRVRSTSWRW